MYQRYSDHLPHDRHYRHQVHAALATYSATSGARRIRSTHEHDARHRVSLRERWETDSAQTLPADACLQIEPTHSRVNIRSCGQQAVVTAQAAIALAQTRGMERIWGIVSHAQWDALQSLGFLWEGAVDGYYHDGPGIVIARSLTGSRTFSVHAAQENAIIGEVLAHGPAPFRPFPADYLLRPALPDDSVALAEMLTAVLPSSAVSGDAEAIEQSMAHDTLYMLVEHDGCIVSAAAARVDQEHLVAEILDCATRPEHRRQGLMGYLLAMTEGKLRATGLRSLYALARAMTVSINTPFARLGYRYRGRLINHCRNAGGWDDMNLWVKPLG